MGKYRYIFGPVLSRRLGLSLGVDLVEPKTCSLNCIYCECGATNRLTIERKEYVPADAVIEELRDFLSKGEDLDYVTFSGSGEPTLNTGIGKIIRFLKSEFPRYKVAILTNGTLFSDESLVADVLDADLIIPSLDAVSEEVFKRLNRPHRDLKIESIVEGLKNLRKRYSGQIFLEIFIVPGLNDTDEEIDKLADIAREIKPDKIQLNSLDRPPAVPRVKKADYSALLRLSLKFDPVAEIIGGYSPREMVIKEEDLMELILNTIRRRPCTREELSDLLKLRMKEVDQTLDILLKNGRIRISSGPRGDYIVLNE
jgi:wyosine [tRNA(Phe)-imidazoG37] synthetase (radical SAM superfamily)